MAARILIGEDSNELVIDENATFSFDRQVSYNASGAADSKTTILRISGRAVEATPESVWDRIIELDDQTQAASFLGPQYVGIELDGELKWEFDPDDCFASPRVVSFRALPSPGAGVSHWDYEMVIEIVQTGDLGADTQDDIYEFRSSIAITTKDGRDIRKVWSASCRAATADAAFAAVRGFGPSKKGITRTLTRYTEDAMATGQWVWEQSKDGGVVETIRIKGQRQVENYVVLPVLGASAKNRPAPLLELLPRGAVEIVVEGVVYGPTSPLALPKPHFATSSEVVAAYAIWEDSGTIPDPDGGFRRSFSEVYLCTATKLPEPNHGDHAAGGSTAPPDGALG